MSYLFKEIIPVAKKKNPSTQSRQQTPSIIGDLITSKHPLKHLGQKIRLCLVHSDLKSLAANDYLC